MGTSGPDSNKHGGLPFPHNCLGEDISASTQHGSTAVKWDLHLGQGQIHCLTNHVRAALRGRITEIVCRGKGCVPTILLSHATWIDAYQIWRKLRLGLDDK